MTTTELKRSIWINAPRERVWRAITDAEQVNQWWNKDDRWEIPALRVGHSHTGEEVLATAMGPARSGSQSATELPAA